MRWAAVGVSAGAGAGTDVVCSVSVIQDYARQQVPQQQWTVPAWDQFKEILTRLEKLDTMLAQPDCKDPAKAAWMREIEARLSKLEDRG